MKGILPPLSHEPVLPSVTVQAAKSKSKLIQIWQLAQLLSIDVALGAVFSSAIMCKLMGIHPFPWLQLFILGGTVQLIYTLDHLWDVQRMQITPVTERHIFHQRYKQLLWIFSAVSAIILGIAAVLLLPPNTLVFWDSIKQFSCSLPVVCQSFAAHERQAMVS